MTMNQMAVVANRLSKIYRLYDHPLDRLKQFFWGRKRKYFHEFTALRDVSFSLIKGQVLGLVGCNGAGKSTLLQILCSTLSPSSGDLKINGRIAALLELGAGFNPEFTGRENVFFNGTVLGLSREEIEARYDEIVKFSGIGDFIDHPVKTYSSGMYVRLAFAIATSVDPDILIIDEALSVGDGAFARKSFDRIMTLRDRGVTIIFCSHLLYQVETLCNQVIWLDQGRVRRLGSPLEVLPEYQAFLDRRTLDGDENEAGESPEETSSGAGGPIGFARLRSVKARVSDTGSSSLLPLQSGVSDLEIEVIFDSDPLLPCPSVAVTFHAPDSRIIASSGSQNDSVDLVRDDSGSGRVKLVYPKIALLKGSYTLSAFVMCERGIHFYDIAPHFVRLEVSQSGVEQGYFALPHQWLND